MSPNWKLRIATVDSSFDPIVYYMHMDPRSTEWTQMTTIGKIQNIMSLSW